MVILRNSFKIFKSLEYMTFRSYSNPTCTKLTFHEYGDPLKVLRMETETLPPLKPDEVLVKFLVAPINPADINLIQGVYPVKAQLPAVGGIEGVGEVVEVGADVTSKALQPGNRVIPNREAFGTWRTMGVCKSDELFSVPKEVNVVEMAGISSNPSTAYRMLADFVDLQPGDVVIQNGANSACGQNVIQLCKLNKYKSVNIVRDRPDIDNLKSHLMLLGADYVLTDEELRKTDLFKSKQISKPKLALNCVGGRVATDVARLLADHGTMVTYGGMSREPVTIPTSAFIFKDIAIRGFWMTRWTRLNKDSELKKSMYEDLSRYMLEGKLKAPEHKLIPLSNYTEAIMKTSSPQGYMGCKYMFDLTK